jgi:hypothetical protein
LSARASRPARKPISRVQRIPPPKICSIESLRL